MKVRLAAIAILGALLCASCARKDPLPIALRHTTENEFVSFITAARANYVGKYRTAALKYRARFKPSHPEVMFELTSSASPVPYRYYRVDLASGAVSPPDVTEVNVAPHAVTEPFALTHTSGIEVTVHSLVWNGIEVSAEPVPKDVEPFTGWVRRWLDYGDTKPQDDVGFSGVIHSVTFPKEAGSVWSTSIDFGTAPVEALEDLLRTLSKMGVRRISVGSSFAAKGTQQGG